LENGQDRGEVSLPSKIKKSKQNFIRPFDLSQAPLMRVGLIKREKDHHILMIDMHHIISDGLSIGILVREFVRLYEGEELPELQIQYKDFAGWQSKWFKTGEMKKQEDYWLNRFSGDIPILNLKTDYPRMGTQRFIGDNIRFIVEEDLCKVLNKVATETETTLFMILMTAFYLLLSRYTEQEDIVVGSPVNGRTHPDIENVIGMLVNTLAMRNYPVKNSTFRGFLAEVKKNVLGDYENQDYPLEELVRKLDFPKNFNRNPLFDVLFASENVNIPRLEIKGLKFVPHPFDNQISHLDLVLYFLEVDDKIVLTLEYSTALYNAATTQRMLENYVEILQQITENSEIKLIDIRLAHDFMVARSTVWQEDETDFNF
jgi:hypothetical protein